MQQTAKEMTLKPAACGVSETLNNPSRNAHAIYAMFAPPIEGQIYTGVVSRVEKYGAFVELPDMTTVLVHKNELEPSSEQMGMDGVVRGPTDAHLITAIGETMELVCMGWDREHGRMKYVPVRVAAEIEAQQERRRKKRP